MLRLGKQIRRYISGVGGFVRKHQNFAGAGHRVDTHEAEAGFFCQRNENISGAGNLVHPRDAFRSKCHSRYGLGASRLIDFVHTRNVGGNQRSGIHLTVRSRRRSHDNSGNTRHFCGKHIHKHAGRVSGLPSGNIHAGNRNRRNPLSQNRPVLLRHNPAVPKLMAVKLRNICGGLFHNRHKLRVSQFVGLFDFLFRHPDSFRRNLASVKLLRIPKKSLVSFFTYFLYNPVNRLLIFSVAVRAPFQKIPHQPVFCLFI